MVISQLIVANECPTTRDNVEAELEREPLVTKYKPLLITWRKARPIDFDGSMGPLVALGWFRTTKIMLNGMKLSYNEKEWCASFSFTMDARIWWESMELKYDMNQMI